MMSRKDYVEVARILKDVDMPPPVRAELAMEFSSFFKRDNARFDIDRFYAAVGFTGYRGNPGRKVPGKFDDSVQEAIFSMDPDEQASFSQGDGWFGLYTGVSEEEVRDAISDNDLADEEEAEDHLVEWEFPVHCILTEDAQGFVTTKTFDSAKDAEDAFGEIEDEVLEVEGG